MTSALHHIIQYVCIIQHLFISRGERSSLQEAGELLEIVGGTLRSHADAASRARITRCSYSAQ